MSYVIVRAASKDSYISGGHIRQVDKPNSRIDPGKFAEEENIGPVAEYETCNKCHGEGVIHSKATFNRGARICPACNGETALNVDPMTNNAYPGTPAKVAVLAARYAQGLPMHHKDDIYLGLPEINSIMQLS